MRRFYSFGLLSVVVFFLLGWMLNCTGLAVPKTSQPFLDLNTTDVVASDWIPVEHWVSTSVFGLPARSYEINQIKINSNTLENNQLYVYSKIDNDIHTLPFTLNTDSSEQRFDYTLPNSSSLRIVTIGLKGRFNPTKKQQYRYILIPNSLVKKSPVNMSDYEEVKMAFHLAE
ncbi:hypothetical protein P1X15_29070 [Runella sp. MFBS21]|uniref:hypothetical protein n=1 Tax=Runella sp. MFBS21 TaxID=3034018 RepID=UPI0023F9C91D|nr:hypothetical protein [Runella sp. MFBS21]MDF7821704.1 hypothetical protein [Runella sp. MFBS21]